MMNVKRWQRNDKSSEKSTTKNKRWYERVKGV